MIKYLVISKEKELRAKSMTLKGENGMQHKGTIRMETERLVLRPLEIEDAENMFQNWSNDPEVTKFLTWPANKEIKMAEDILKIWKSQYEKSDFYQWGIVPKSFGEVIGTISVVELDERVEKVQIGYCIGRKWWGQGYTTEAFAAIISFLFEEVGVNRIETMYDLRNPGSGKVMKKCGLQYEGTLRQAGWSNSGIGDMAMYSILASEYFQKHNDAKI